MKGIVKRVTALELSCVHLLGNTYFKYRKGIRE